MELNDATLKRNAGLLYGTIILLGMLLSGFVYLSSEKVEKSTLQLVEKEIPIFDQLKRLDSSFTEQERYLYEYYATQDRLLFTEEFVQQATETEALIQLLIEQNVAPQTIQQLKTTQEKIMLLSVDYDVNMNQDGFDIDWDKARSDLEMFSQYRRETKPILENIASDTNRRVQQQYMNTKDELNQTSYTVLFYSLVILLMAVVIGKSVNRSINVSANNRRLALFPQRNPNPIFSIDNDNQVVFANPATDVLLEELNMDMAQFCSMLHDDIAYHQSQLQKEDGHHNVFDLEIKHKTLSCELHWLKDMATWDIHLIDITNQKNAEKKLHYQAFHEVSTGLYNKNKLLNMLDKSCELPANFAIGAMEIRGYSQLVSRLGLEHAAKVVSALSSLLELTLAKALPETNYTFFQLSDKQFAILLQSDLCHASIEKLVKKVETKVEHTNFESDIHLELDFGFSCYPEHANSTSSLMKCVNIALEKATNIDHSSLVIYDESLGQSIQHEIELTNKLRMAIEKQLMQLYFQPQLDIQQNKIVGLETLIRWPVQDGFISPAEFIPLAEKSGLIIPLGQWIAEQACMQAKRFIDMGYDDIVVAINISPQQFKHPAFFDMIQGVLAITRVPPGNIELEITEGVVMYNESETIALLHKLKELGLKLSIDDFGTGYSSLSYLKRFPIDKLKIDQSFIFNLDNNAADRAIVNTVIDLGKHLDLTLIAEGVETQEHQDILLAMGCHEIQGYHFSRPLPVNQLVEFLQKQSKAAQLKVS